jgi:hypothetical protein
MKHEDKILLEKFATEVLAINSSVAVQTTDLPTLGYSMEQLSDLIAAYKKLNESEQKFTFEKGFASRTDVNRFAIVIKKK